MDGHKAIFNAMKGLTKIYEANRYR